MEDSLIARFQNLKAPTLGPVRALIKPLSQNVYHLGIPWYIRLAEATLQGHIRTRHPKDSNQKKTEDQSPQAQFAAKTGHGSVQSLWHYIDLAWEELGVWGSIDKAIARLHAADQLFADLLALQRETETLDKRQANRKIDLKQIADRLGEIISIAKQDVEVHELHGKLRIPAESTTQCRQD